MRRLMKAGALLCLLLVSILSGAAQDAEGALDADRCVAAAVADWSPPQTLEEASVLQEALAQLIAGCRAEAEAESGDAEEGLTDADADFPRTMYVTSRAPRINVRRYASTSSAIVATLAHAAPVEVLGRARGASYRGNAVWYRIDAGYVHRLLLGGTETATAATPPP
ncbi:MAG: SH3 domain-containing protein, partial [Anaerolineaceae bacterium]|nr:SH3 domain-containing protein [Anaerolineaceae bacterium]